MSTIDPAKLKVVELRSELTARGLDTKGNKPVLVKRLKDALEKELKKELPDTSIADTSTEDLNTSQESIAEGAVQNVPPDEKEEEDKTENMKQSQSEPEGEENIEDTKKQSTAMDVSCPPVQDVKEIKKEVEENKKDPEIKTSVEDIQKGAEELEEAEEIEKDPETEVDEEMKEENEVKIEAEETSHIENDDKVVEEEENKKTSESSKEQSTRGEKRRRFSQSPERYQRRRSKTPIVEDEPVLDNEKVYLSWYDSDLHLQVDKKTFLAGKPLHDGAFGYAWAGVRATHGVNSGKVCFEVKVTEELKWDDLVKHSDKKRDGHGSRRDRRNDRSSSRNDKNRGRGTNNERSKRSENSGNESKKVEENSNSEATDNKDSGENTEKEESTTNGDNQESKAEGSEIVGEQMETNDDPKEEETKADGESKQVGEQESKEEAPESEQCKNEPESKESLDVDKENKEEEVKEELKEDEENREAEVTDESKEDQVKPDECENKDSETKTEAMEVEETPVQEIPKHIFRVGWSVLSSGLQLGEAEHSYGYESSGKFVSNKEFIDYGVKFSVGDVVGAYLDVSEDAVTLIFTHNGQSLGVAKTMSKVELGEDFVLFPHILTRNCSFELNLGGGEEPWTAHPEELLDYLYLEKSEEKVPGPLRPESRSECEVIMMCGLPASGKTFWVKKFVEESPEKRYNVIGNSHLLEKMTVNGNPLKNSYKGRWNVILDRLMKCVNVLVEVAAARRRNFIIDQTNVFPSAQRRKMRLFEGYKRRAVVVVVADEEQTKRRALQEAQDGKDVPDSAILEMKANMNLPRRGDWLEEVSYVELNEEDAKTLVQKYNHQGREAGFGPLSNQRNSSYRDNRGHPYRWDHTTSRRDYRGGYRDNRSYGNRNNRSRQQSTWQNRRPPPGSWNRDVRRDSRSSNSSRDFRNNNRSVGPRHERSDSRDNRNRTSGSSGGGSYNRNSRSQSSRNQVPSWQGGNSGSGGGTGSSWQNQGSWNSSQPGMWSQGSWNQGNWGGQSQQWKGNYGQQQQQGGSYGQGYNNYPNWNYYGQYAQNWNSQGQPQTIADGAVGTTTEKSNSYGQQQYSQDVSWSQQYATPYGQYTQGEPTA